MSVKNHQTFSNFSFLVFYTCGNIDVRPQCALERFHAYLHDDFARITRSKQQIDTWSMFKNQESTLADVSRSKYVFRLRPHVSVRTERIEHRGGTLLRIQLGVKAYTSA